MKKKLFLEITGFFTFAMGIIFLLNSQLDITGAVIGLNKTFSLISFFVGMVLIIASILILSSGLALEDRAIKLSSSIKKNPTLLKLAKDAVENQVIEREMNHLIHEMQKGNFEAGLGHPSHIEGTRVYYSRGRNVARLYYIKIGENNYEIVAKSAKHRHRNQDLVMNELRRIYG